MSFCVKTSWVGLSLQSMVCPLRCSLQMGRRCAERSDDGEYLIQERRDGLLCSSLQGGAEGDEMSSPTARACCGEERMCRLNEHSLTLLNKGAEGTQGEEALLSTVARSWGDHARLVVVLVFWNATLIQRANGHILWSWWVFR